MHGRPGKLTNYIFQACVPGNSLSVIAFPSFETLGKVHHRLDGFPLKIEFVNAALRYHLTWRDAFSRMARAERG